MLLSLVEKPKDMTLKMCELYRRNAATHYKTTNCPTSKQEMEFLDDIMRSCGKPKPYDPVPSCSDLFELSGLYDMGYRNFLLCDELCLKDHMLSAATNAFSSFRGQCGRKA
jgi:hypothetical protein